MTRPAIDLNLPPRRAANCAPCAPRPLARAIALALAAGFSFAGEASAQPQGGVVVGGQASIAPAGNTTTINQGTPRLAINWQSFNIGAGESVVFNQPGAASIALNRILGGDPSRIFGNLSANGQVFLINPNGVLFGRGAEVNVGGLVASTLDLDPQSFMTGQYRLRNTGGAGAVVNEGALRAAPGGYIALLGPQVSNDGVIVAKLGTVALAAGNAVSIDFTGNGLINVQVDEAAVNASAANRQLIRADGGQVIMTARAKDALLNTVVNNTGVIEARSVVRRNGVIRLDGGESGVVSVTGTLDARGVHSEETGGEIKVLGQYVGVFDAARLDASGASGGGTVLVGGNYQGKGMEQNATATVIAPSASIHADALVRGDGGKVIVWADDVTRFYGAITARAGAQGGNGGLAETSGRSHLEAAGSVDVSALAGTGGTWLLDPRDVDIRNLASSGGAFSGGNPNTFTPSADSAVADRNAIQASLNGGSNVIVTTGATGVQAGNITVTDTITKTAGAASTLTLNAAGGVNINNAIAATGNALNVTLNAASGNVNFGAAGSIASRRGNVAITAGGAAALGNINTTAGAGAGNLSVTANGAITQTAGTALRVQGAATLNAGAANGITLANAGNDFIGAVTVVNTNSATLRDANALNLGASSVIGTLNLTAGGAITQTGAITANVLTTKTLVNAGAAVTLANAANNAASVDLRTRNAADTANAAGAITYRDADAVAIQTIATTSNVSLTAGGALSQTGAITAATLTATTLNDSGAAIDFRYAGNNVATLSLAARNAANATNAAGALSYRDVDGYAISGLRTTANAALQNGGAVTQTAAIAAAGLQLLGTGAYTLSNAGNDIATVAGNTTAAINYTDANALSVGTVNGTSGLTSNNVVTLTAGGALSQSSAITATTLTATTLNNAGAAIDFSNAGNNVVTLNLAARNAANATNAAGALSYRDVDGYAISGLRTTANAALQNGGAVTQTAAIAAAGLQLLGTGAYTLSNAGNDIATLAGSTTGAIAYRDANAVSVGTVNGSNGITTSAGLTLTAGGALTQTQAIASANLIAKTLLNAGASITLSNAANNVGSVDARARNGADTANAAGAINYGDMDGFIVAALATTANASLQSGGAVTQTGAINAAGLQLLGSGAYTLNNAANDIASLAAGTTNSISYRDASALTVSAVNATSGITATGAVALTAGGALAQTQAIVAPTLSAKTLSNANAPVTLQNAGNNVAALDLRVRNAADTANGTGSIAYRDADGFNIAALATAGTASLNAGGAVSQSAPVAVAGLELLGAASYTLQNAGNAVTTLAANTGSLAYAQPNSVVLGTVGATNGITVANAVEVRTTSAAADITVNRGITVGGAGNALVLAAGRNFINNAGAAALAAPAGRWLVYSTNPATDNKGGLVPAFKRYNRTYAANPPGSVSEAGNGFSYGIAPALSVTPGAVSGSYGDAPDVSAPGFSLAGFIDSDTAATAGLSGAAVFSTTATSTANVGAYGIAYSTGLLSALGYKFIDNAASTGEYSITPRPISVTAPDASRNYGDANPVLTSFTVGGAGLVNGDAIGGVTNTIAATATPTANASSSHAITPSAATFSSGQPSNYAVSYNNGVLTITQRPIAVVTDPRNKVYGDADPALGQNISSGSLVNGDVFSGALARSPGENVGGYAINQGTLALSGNYSLSFTGNTLTITPASLTIRADDKTRIYGDANPALSAAFAGLRNGDTQAVVSGLVVNTPASVSANVGGYAIAPGGAVASNYTISYANGTLTVTPRAIGIAADPKSKIYGDADPALNFAVTAGNLVNGDAFSGALTRGAGENAGGYAIDQGSLALSGNYTLSFNGGAFTITPASLTVAADGANKIQGAANPPFSATYSGFKFADTPANLSGNLAFSTAATAVSPPGSHAVTPSGLSSSNYVITFVDGTLQIAPAPAENADPRVQGALLTVYNEPTEPTLRGMARPVNIIDCGVQLPAGLADPTCRVERPIR